MNTRIPSTVACFVLFPVVALWSAAASVAVADGPKPDAPAAKAKTPASAERIAKLIAELGNKDYYARQRAQDE